MYRVVPKPQSLLDLHEPMADLFELVRHAFGVPRSYQLSLAHVDAAEEEMYDTLALASLALRKVQALRHVSRPEVRTAVHVFVSLVSELGTALTDLAGRCVDTRTRNELAAYRDRLYEAAHNAAALQQENTILVLE